MTLAEERRTQLKRNCVRECKEENSMEMDAVSEKRHSLFGARIT